MTTLWATLATVLIYLGSKILYRKKPTILLYPILICPAVIILLLILTGIPYETYQGGTAGLTFFLQPATVAFAIPLYKYFALLKEHALEILLGVCAGSLLAFITTIIPAALFHFDPNIIVSLAPRSITTPLAIIVSTSLGGVPYLTAVFVIITGMAGAVIGPLVIRCLGINDEIARGTLFGMGAHAIGTSKAFEFSPVTGTISSLSMILGALITIISAPIMLDFCLTVIRDLLFW